VVVAALFDKAAGSNLAAADMGLAGMAAREWHALVSVIMVCRSKPDLDMKGYENVGVTWYHADNCSHCLGQVLDGGMVAGVAGEG